MAVSNWFKARRYLHFDRPVSEKIATEYITTPLKVSAHSFYPFIRNLSLTTKTKYDVRWHAFSSVEKYREISCAAHMDSHIYAYYALLLSTEYEREIATHGLGEVVLAFRSMGGKSNIHHAHMAFEAIKQRGDCSVLCFDIEKFFDRLDHNLLKASWKGVLGVSALPADHFAVYKAITKHAWVNREDAYGALGKSVHNPSISNNRLCEAAEFRKFIRDGGFIHRNPNPYGIPQGSPISAILSNIYMVAFDRAMISYLAPTESVFYRYCDDIMIICPTSIEAQVERVVEQEIKKLRLNLQHKKTDVRRFTKDYRGVIRAEKPIQYLGFMFDGQRTFIRPASLTRYYRKMKVKIRLAKNSRDRINVLRRKRGESDKALFLKSIYNGYTHFGRRNFITYGYRAAKLMGSNTIRKQLRSHWRKLQKEIAS